MLICVFRFLRNEIHGSHGQHYFRSQHCTEQSQSDRKYAVALRRSVLRSRKLEYTCTNCDPRTGVRKCLSDARVIFRICKGTSRCWPSTRATDSLPCCSLALHSNLTATKYKPRIAYGRNTSACSFLVNRLGRLVFF